MNTQMTAFAKALTRLTMAEIAAAHDRARKHVSKMNDTRKAILLQRARDLMDYYKSNESRLWGELE